MTWLRKFFSADNSEIDIKAVLSAGAFIIAIGMYLAYGIKGLLTHWEMPAAIKEITIWFIVGGLGGAAATMFNQKLGVQTPPAPCPEPKPPEAAG